MDQACKKYQVLPSRIKAHIKSQSPLNDHYWVALDDFNGNFEQIDKTLREQYQAKLLNNQLKRTQNAKKVTSCRVQCIETGEIFEALSDARRRAGYPPGQPFSLKVRYQHKCKDGYTYRYLDSK